MSAVLDSFYGALVVVRPPVPATLNKAGANYKSEVAHLHYSPRGAYREWLTICDAILACGGDAMFAFEDSDDPFLDVSALRVDAEGGIHAAGSAERLGSIDDVDTGRVFAANGPWVVAEDTTLRAVMQHMLPHRRAEAAYYRELLASIADQGGYQLELHDNPHRWEGMADVAVVGERVILTYAVPGHYDEGIARKSERSSRAGVAFAADVAGVPESERVYVELRYPHFHGDTVHFGARPTAAPPVLVHFAGGLWGDGSEIVKTALGPERIVAISELDAVEHYCGNSRQIGSGVLVPAQASSEFEGAMDRLGLAVHRVPLFELFGKAGGGPGCTTLYLPSNVRVPTNSPLRYSIARNAAWARLERIPDTLEVDAELFAGRQRG